MTDYQSAWLKLRVALEELQDHYEALERWQATPVNTARAETVAVALAYMGLAEEDSTD